MTVQEFKELLPSLPTQAGVYRFIAETGEILYIGKAKNLPKRLQSYFSQRKDMRNKTRTMVRRAQRIEFTVVDTEQDALLLEATLIRKHKPRYNVALKWTKPYPYICITNERFPRVMYSHDAERKSGARYFGPYTSKQRVLVLLDLIKELFQLRTCELHLSQESIDKSRHKVCLEYHIKNCKAPCVGLETEAEYMQKVEEVANILKGNFVAVRKYLDAQIAQYSENMEFERAHEVQQKLQAFDKYQSKSTVVSMTIGDVDVFSLAQTEEGDTFVNYIKVVQGAIINACTIELERNLQERPADILGYAVSELRDKFGSYAPEIIAPMKFTLPEKTAKIHVPQVGDKKKLLDLSVKNLNYFILQQRKTDLNRAQQQTKSEQLLAIMQKDLRTPRPPVHIECFDNSNLQGTFPVSAMVVFRNGKPSKRDYRHYNVKTVDGPNDFASMEEVVFRRYKRLLESKATLPDLIVIDGGKGQLSSALKSLQALGIAEQISVIGIAKRLEEIYFATDEVPLLLSKKSPTLKIIQQLRDEAHRFGITFHRDQRSRGFTITELTQIKGIGEKTAELLLTHFQSVTNIKTTPLKALAEVIGAATAKKVRDYFDTPKADNTEN
jgi:excinuclease ABC subunit C